MSPNNKEELIKNACKLRTIFCQHIHWSWPTSCGLREKRANFTASNNCFNRFILSSIANDNTNATIQSPGSCIHLTIHATCWPVFWKYNLIFSYSVIYEIRRKHISKTSKPSIWERITMIKIQIGSNFFVNFFKNTLVRYRRTEIFLQNTDLFQPVIEEAKFGLKKITQTLLKKR